MSDEFTLKNYRYFLEKRAADRVGMDAAERRKSTNAALRLISAIVESMAVGESSELAWATIQKTGKHRFTFKLKRARR